MRGQEGIFRFINFAYSVRFSHNTVPTQKLIVTYRSDIPSFRVSLRAIVIESNDIRGRMSVLASDIQSVQLNADSIQQRLGDDKSTALESFTRASNRFTNHQTTFRVQTSVYSGCRALCARLCHKESRLRSPKWMETIIGTMFLSYSGISVGFSRKCTEVGCLRNDSSHISVYYYFPCWFLQRMIILRSRYSLLNGNYISVKTPRVVGAWTDIFEAAQHCQVEKIRSLLSQKKRPVHSM